MKMKTVLLLTSLLIGVTTAARRSRSTTTSSPTTSSRQLPFAHQPEELENSWEHLDIQKLDRRLETQDSNSVTPTSTRISDGQNRTSTTLKPASNRQFYPGFPPSPGDSGEFPKPISPPTYPPTYPPSYPPPTRPPPSPAPGCLELRGQYPSDKSCANYLNCWDDVVIEQQCPNGLLFNDQKNYCDFDYNVNCGSRPAPTPKPSLPPGSRRCPDLNGHYRSSTNCSEFYVCLAGRPIKFSCARGLVYNDELNVCDYVYNVDCKGSSTPTPPPPSSTSPGGAGSQRPTYPPQHPQPSQPPQQPSHPPQQPSHPPQQPSYPPQQPTYPPQQPSYPSQQPSYPSQQPSYPSQQPSYPPQQPTYPPQQPSYPPQQPSYPSQEPSYPVQPSYPWPARENPDLWHQRPVPSQIEIDEQNNQQGVTSDELFSQPSTTISGDESVTTAFLNPWDNSQDAPTELSNTRPCENGAVHRLDDFCTSVLVCRDHKPHLVKCSTGFTYDKPSDSCKPFSIAKC